jgi:hypothetical protein
LNVGDAEHALNLLVELNNFACQRLVQWCCLVVCRAWSLEWLLPPCRALGTEQVITPWVRSLCHSAAQIWSGIEIYWSSRINHFWDETYFRILFKLTGLLDECNFKILVIYFRILQIGLSGSIWVRGNPDIDTGADLGVLINVYQQGQRRAQERRAERGLCSHESITHAHTTEKYL